ARLQSPTPYVGQQGRGEHRVPRRREREEIGALLQVPAVVELELVAEAPERGARRETRVEGQVLLPPVEALESSAALDVLIFVSPAQLARAQAPGHSSLDHGRTLKRVAAEVDRVVEPAQERQPPGGGPLVAQPHAPSRLVELVQVPVFPHQESSL